MKKTTTELELINRIYAAALEPAEWQPLLESLSDFFAAEVADLHLLKDGQVLHRNLTGNSAELWQEYFTHYHSDNPRFDRMLPALPAGAVFNDRQFMSVNAMKRHVFYNFLNKNDMFCSLMAKIVDHDGQMSAIGFHGDRTAEKHLAEDMQTLRRLMPHLQRAVAFRYKLGGAAARVSEQFAELSGDGMIFFNVQGRVMYVNDAAEEMLPEVRMDRHDGRLMLPHKGAQAWLRRALSAALERVPPQTDGPCVYTIPANGRAGPWLLRLTPVAGSLRYETGFAALLLISAPVFAPNAATASILSRRYHLTPTEIALVEALVDGCSLRQFAEANFRCYETLRSRLKKTYEKTGTKSQTQLVLLMTGIADPDTHKS